MLTALLRPCWTIKLGDATASPEPEQLRESRAVVASEPRGVVLVDAAIRTRRRIVPHTQAKPQQREKAAHKGALEHPWRPIVRCGAICGGMLESVFMRSSSLFGNLTYARQDVPS